MFDVAFLKKFGVKHHKIVKKGRSRSVALVERKNQTIAKIINKILAQVELTTGHPSSKWVSYLPLIIKTINEKVDEFLKTIKPVPLKDVPPMTFNPDHKIDLLNAGDKVRVALDKPMNIVGNRLSGRFRTGDIRWDPKIRTVKYFFTKPNEPIMYFLDGDDNHHLQIESVGYTRNQLQKVSTQEREVDEEQPLFQNEEYYEIQKILDRKKVGRLYEYLVKFKNYRKAEWIKRKVLVEDLGISHMKALDAKFDSKIVP